MNEPITAELVGFHDLRHEADCIPQYRGMVEVSFVVTPDEARRVRTGDVWTLTPPEDPKP